MMGVPVVSRNENGWLLDLRGWLVMGRSGTTGDVDNGGVLGDRTKRRPQ